MKCRWTWRAPASLCNPRGCDVSAAARGPRVRGPRRGCCAMGRRQWGKRRPRHSQRSRYVEGGWALWPCCAAVTVSRGDWAPILKIDDSTPLVRRTTPRAAAPPAEFINPDDKQAVTAHTVERARRPGTVGRPLGPPGTHISTKADPMDDLMYDHPTPRSTTRDQMAASSDRRRLSRRGRDRDSGRDPRRPPAVVT